MLFIIIILCLTLVIAQEKESLKDDCLQGKLLLNHCKCDFISPYSSSEVRLTCKGNGATKSATKIMEDSNLQVVALTITSASIQHLTADTLKNFPHLKQLVLPQNSIKYIESLAFQDIPEILLLDLSNNYLAIVKQDTFKFLKKLQNISLAHNEIDSIDKIFFHEMVDLQHIDLSSNNLNIVDSEWFNNSRKILYLSFANNAILSLEKNSFLHLAALQVLDLSGNRLSILPSSVFIPLYSLQNISLAMNDFRTIHNEIFRGNMILDKVNLTGNPWVCDKNLLPLLDWLKLHEIDKANCLEPLEFSNSSLQTSLYVLYLEFKLDESPICNASMCNCTVSRDKYVVTVDCVKRGFTKLPETLPFKTKVLDLRGNNIQSVTIEHLNVTQWADVAFLHLNNNFIDSLKGLEGTWLLHNLVALHLSKNQLTEIPIHMLEQFRGGLLDELYLSGNPWNCDCNTVRFQTWLQDNYKSVKDFDGIRCSPESGIYSNQPIYRLLKSQLCPQQVQLINYLDVLNSLMAVAIILIIMKLSFDYWLQKRTGKLPRFFSLNVY